MSLPKVIIPSSSSFGYLLAVTYDQIDKLVYSLNKVLNQHELNDGFAIDTSPLLFGRGISLDREIELAPIAMYARPLFDEKGSAKQGKVLYSKLLPEAKKAIHNSQLSPIEQQDALRCIQLLHDAYDDFWKQPVATSSAKSNQSVWKVFVYAYYFHESAQFQHKAYLLNPGKRTERVADYFHLINVLNNLGGLAEDLKECLQEIFEMV